MVRPGTNKHKQMCCQDDLLCFSCAHMKFLIVNEAEFEGISYCKILQERDEVSILFDEKRKLRNFPSECDSWEWNKKTFIIQTPAKNR